MKAYLVGTLLIALALLAFVWIRDPMEEEREASLPEKSAATSDRVGASPSVQVGLAA